MNDDIEELKQIIEPLKDWKYWEYNCTDEDIKKAMENKSYIEVVLEEQSKTIKELQQELQRKDNNWNELKDYISRFLYMLNGILDRDVYEQCQLDDFTQIMDKIKELEEK